MLIRTCVVRIYMYMCSWSIMIGTYRGRGKKLDGMVPRAPDVERTHCGSSDGL